MSQDPPADPAVVEADQGEGRRTVERTIRRAVEPGLEDGDLGPGDDPDRARPDTVGEVPRQRDGVRVETAPLRSVGEPEAEVRGKGPVQEAALSRLLEAIEGGGGSRGCRWGTGRGR